MASSSILLMLFSSSNWDGNRKSLKCLTLNPTWNNHLPVSSINLNLVVQKGVAKPVGNEAVYLIDKLSPKKRENDICGSRFVRMFDNLFLLSRQLHCYTYWPFGFSQVLSRLHRGSDCLWPGYQPWTSSPTAIYIENTKNPEDGKKRVFSPLLRSLCFPVQKTCKRLVSHLAVPSLDAWFWQKTILTERLLPH